MAAFKFDLVSPERLLISEEVEAVVIPGAEGEMTVMANHAPVMTTIKPGVVTVKAIEGGDQRYVVFGGFADILPGRLHAAGRERRRGEGHRSGRSLPPHSGCARGRYGRQGRGDQDPRAAISRSSDDAGAGARRLIHRARPVLCALRRVLEAPFNGLLDYSKMYSRGSSAVCGSRRQCCAQSIRGVALRAAVNNPLDLTPHHGCADGSRSNVRHLPPARCGS